VVATGSPPPTYQWQKDGTDIASANGATYTIASAQDGDAGSYPPATITPPRRIASPNNVTGCLVWHVTEGCRGAKLPTGSFRNRSIRIRVERGRGGEAGRRSRLSPTSWVKSRRARAHGCRI
jgi:hypothetical protein